MVVKGSQTHANDTGSRVPKCLIIFKGNIHFRHAEKDTYRYSELECSQVVCVGRGLTVNEIVHLTYQVILERA